MSLLTLPFDKYRESVFTVWVEAWTKQHSSCVNHEISDSDASRPSIMGGKSKAPAKKDPAAEAEKVAAKAAKAREKALADFIKAAKQGDRSKVEGPIIAGTIDINYANEKGQTAAHMAAAFGHKKILQFLHGRGARFDLETNDQHKFTPLTAARFVGETEAAEYIEALLDGTALDAKDSDEESNDDEDECGASQIAASASGQLVSKQAKKRPPAAAAQPATAALPSAGADGAQSGSIPPVDTAPFIAERDEHIDKSESDERAYRWLRLTNDLQVMLVSDPTCDYAAAAMDVGIGSASDPEAFPGLAHFLEHMLFLGTQKFPKEVRAHALCDPVCSFPCRHPFRPLTAPRSMRNLPSSAVAIRMSIRRSWRSTEASRTRSPLMSTPITTLTCSGHTLAARSTASLSSSCAPSSPRGPRSVSCPPSNPSLQRTFSRTRGGCSS